MMYNYESYRESIIKDFEIDEADIAPFNILFVSFDGEGYEEAYFILLENKDSKKLYEINASHCSCDEFAGQFDPEETSIELIKNQIWKNGRFFQIFPPSEIEELKKVIESIEKVNKQ